MKIFNWVHRKFNSKDGPNIGDVRKKAERHDTQALLEQAALADVIDTWKQGILTIGTFGFDPLKEFTAQQKEIQLIIANQEEEESEISFEEDLEEEEGGGGGEQDPLVLNAFKHGFNNDICSDIHAQSEITLASDDDHEYKKKERITLADLLSADSDHHMDTKPTHHVDHDRHKLLQPELGVAIKIKIKIKPEEEEPAAAHAKPKLSFAKKLIPPLLKEDSHLHPHPRPIKKIHRMMTRILKRKIHPELEGKKQNKENHCDNIGANETLSLLQTQDAIACA